MNLNEECLLQFLQGEGLAPSRVDNKSASNMPAQAPLTADLKRVIRRDRYVSFPPAILVKRDATPWA